AGEAEGAGPAEQVVDREVREDQRPAAGRGPAQQGAGGGPDPHDRAQGPAGAALQQHVRRALPEAQPEPPARARGP
ncbi:unnamed protein product, partial [Heterosigma akashiwo]